MESKTKVVYEPLKRKRGRPKKEVDAIILNQPTVQKRKRGRPKKEKVSIFNLVADELKKDPMLKVEKPYYDISTNEIVHPENTREVISGQDILSAMELFRYKQKIITKVIDAILKA